MKMLSFAAGAAVLVSACATPPEKVAATYVSPVLYQGLSCDQLAMEASRVSARAAQMTGQQSKSRTQDNVATGVALVVFWPAMFLIGGDDAQTAELGRLKGEMDAIQQASTMKSCGIEFKSA